VGTALLDFDDFDVTQAKLTARLGRAFAVALRQLSFRTLLQAPDGGNDDTHRTANFISPAALRRLGFSRRPHLFQIVEGAYFRPEHMDDDITGIDQHPVALPHTLDADTTAACLLDILDQVVGHGADMAL